MLAADAVPFSALEKPSSSPFPQVELASLFGSMFPLRGREAKTIPTPFPPGSCGSLEPRQAKETEINEAHTAAEALAPFALPLHVALSAAAGAVPKSVWGQVLQVRLMLDGRLRLNFRGWVLCVGLVSFVGGFQVPVFETF